MDVTQVYTLVNQATKEAIGTEALAEWSAQGVIDAGQTIENFTNGLDAYVHALPNVIGRMVFVDRKYSGSAPSVLMESWEFGSIMLKVRGGVYDAEENESWELTDGASYEMNIFHKPKASAVAYNKRVTFEIPYTITEKQVKQSFHSPEELAAFISMIYTDIENSMTLKLDSLILRTICNMAAETIYQGVGTTYGNSSVRAVNLLKLYNDAYSKSLTTAAACKDPDFLRFACYTIGLYKVRMSKASTLFNEESEMRFTPTESMRTILLADFAKGAEVYLYNNNGQFKDEYLALGDYDTVPFWQGSGTSYAYTDVSKIKCKTSANHSIEVPGVLGCVFDKNACAVACQDKRTTVAPYNAKGEFWNYWAKWDAGYLNAFDENFVVFFAYAA